MQFNDILDIRTLPDDVLKGAITKEAIKLVKENYLMYSRAPYNFTSVQLENIKDDIISELYYHHYRGDILDLLRCEEGYNCRNGSQ